MRPKLYAAIDIGTNAARLMIGKVVEEDGGDFVQQIQLVRSPIRLGEDVFDKGEISNLKLKNFIYTLRSFKLLAKAYGVSSIKACATSAMREASNKQFVLDTIYQKTKLKIEVIDGEREADLIFKSFNMSFFDDTRPHLFIDVGGGSTELTIFGKNDMRYSQSFQIGTIRKLKNKVDENIWNDISDWINTYLDTDKNYTGIGSGGNINKISQVARKRYLEPITIEELKNTYDYLNSTTFEYRVDHLRMNRTGQML
ncbi:MAG: hypothetical protein R2771_00515 [Saprospiraceae bacterium]